jgi:hypothetical protein
MSPPVLILAYTAFFLLVSYRLADRHLRGHYACPHCGTRSAKGHAADCPWKQ